MISFGVEFEFDAIDRSGNLYRGCGDTPRYLSRHWGFQPDHTTTYELRSPVFTSLEQFVEECNNQFGGWLRNVRGEVPYMCSVRPRSLGQHMHLGMPDRELYIEEKEAIARAVLEFYPLLMAIHAQPIPSDRGLTTTHARPMYLYNSYIDRDHYAEISESHHGTVELRIFDANVPQASLTCAMFATKIAEVALRREIDGRFDWARYREDRERALRYGLVGIDVTRYLRALKGFVGNFEIPEIPAIREALYMMARYRMNFWAVWRYLGLQAYTYMRACLSDVSKYLENLIGHVNGDKRVKVERWIRESREIENIDQLIGLSVGVDERLIEAISQRVEQLVRERPELAERLADRAERAGLSRSEVREALERGNYMLLRLHEVPDMSQREVAEHVSTLLREHGNGFNRAMSAHEIVESPARFYVLHVYDRGRGRGQIVGAIAVRIRTGEISSLVVDRRFRRLGAGRILLNHALSVLRDNGQSEAYACVRNGNEASMRLFESLGFVASERHEKYVVYRRSLSGDE
ncbi:MAG: GNAT family N-acetyltransferase [Ignisphaera sp.]